MKKLLKTILVFVLWLLIASPVLAQPKDFFDPDWFTNLPQEGTVSSQERLKKVEERVRIRREAIHEQLQGRQAHRIARLSEIRKGRIRGFFARLMKRMRAAVRRLEILVTRIESRLDKIESADEEVDVTDIRADIKEAKDKLGQASEALIQAEVSLEDILSDDDPKEAFVDVRNLIREIKEQLIEIHRLLVQAIGKIRGLRVGQTE